MQQPTRPFWGIALFTAVCLLALNAFLFWMLPGTGSPAPPHDGLVLVWNMVTALPCVLVSMLSYGAAMAVATWGLLIYRFGKRSEVGRWPIYSLWVVLPPWLVFFWEVSVAFFTIWGTGLLLLAVGYFVLKRRRRRASIA